MQTNINRIHKNNRRTETQEKEVSEEVRDDNLNAGSIHNPVSISVPEQFETVTHYLNPMTSTSNMEFMR